MSRAARIAGILAIFAGGLLLADAAATVLWQEPVTALVAVIDRAGTDRRYLAAANLPLTGGDRGHLAALPSYAERMAFIASREAARVPDGDAIGELSIPAIGVAYDVVQGTSAGDLARGPGHYPETDLPGEGGTVAIAGHRTTYLAPFRNIGRLREGQRIIVRMAYGTFTYAVQATRVTSPSAWWITRDVGYDRLVLSACAPVYSDTERLVVFARLIGAVPAAGTPV